MSTPDRIEIFSTRVGSFSVHDSKRFSCARDASATENRCCAFLAVSAWRDAREDILRHNECVLKAMLARHSLALAGGRALTTKIRPETSTDMEVIKAVTAAAFLDAPYASGTEHLIVGALREAGALTISLVAEMNGRVVGHVAISPVFLSDGSSGWFGLGPLSVLPELQRRGIGSSLVHEALGLLRERGAAGCVLLGNPAYYRRFGFKSEPTLTLPGVAPEHFQALSFEAVVPRATVAFHDAFRVQPEEGG